MVLVGRDLGGAAVGGEIEPAVAPQVEPAVNLARRVVAFGQVQGLADVDQPAKGLLLGVVFVDEGGPRAVDAGAPGADGEMVADRGVILAVDRQAVPPGGPGVSRVGLAGVIEEINRRGGFGDG
jgi:hypothetical protein